MARTPVRALDSEDATIQRPDPKRLHDATDKLNETLLKFEETLRSLKLGVSAYVKIDEEDNGRETGLSFAKHQGDFKLLILNGNDAHDDSWQTTLLTSASRELRLRAVDYLERLYKNLLKAFDAEIGRVHESINEVEQLNEAIRTKARK